MNNLLIHFTHLWTEKSSKRCSVKKVFLEISQNWQGNTCARVSCLINLQAEACNFIKKETLSQAFSSGFWEISKSTFSHRTPLVAASVRNYSFKILIKKKESIQKNGAINNACSALRSIINIEGIPFGQNNLAFPFTNVFITRKHKSLM